MNIEAKANPTKNAANMKAHSIVRASLLMTLFVHFCLHVGVKCVVVILFLTGVNQYVKQFCLARTLDAIQSTLRQVKDLRLRDRLQEVDPTPLLKVLSAVVPSGVSAVVKNAEVLR